ncbi:MAG: hypothetical protein A2920_02045 [Candidatus Zambryskibacteria bacterium RIFCSPLOWO2_01_FULL_43_17]|uniref:Uncharacterized protein n=1 Tax=Candidatus Zambryskibacteria bacterium RIFCSPLOWO2_01_FULL_43_17 TaxID=1802760 RepID=A0A1G2U5B8_9BACT|nr:MAG: hypothetical protein A2920_02045 [Candidatus Zambryskibacteria bacterium RIFCSPLOWO2_01_FULL_43_17]
MKYKGIESGMATAAGSIDIEGVIKSDAEHIVNLKQKRDDLLQQLKELDEEMKSTGAFSFGKKKVRSVDEIIRDRAEKEDHLDIAEREIELLEAEESSLSSDLDSGRRQIFSGKRDLDLPLQ